MINHEEILEYCKQLRITPNQFNFCYLLFVKDYTALKSFTETTYIDSEGNKKSLAIKKSEVTDLIERGFVTELFSDKKNTSFLINEKFGKYLFLHEDDAGEELWNNYFSHFVIHGVNQSARTCDKDKLMEMYLKKIRRSKKKHKEIMELLEVFKTMVKEGKMQPMGIEKFVVGENWEVVKNIKEKSGESWDDSL